MSDISHIKSQFPIFDNKINNKDLIYLDSAASAQKPKIVLDTLHKAYTETYSNVHRGLHWLSETSTEKYENVNDPTNIPIPAKGTISFNVLKSNSFLNL